MSKIDTGRMQDFIQTLFTSSSGIVLVTTLVCLQSARTFERIFDPSRELGCFSCWTTPHPPFANAAVLITGAGSGLGKATAFRLGRANWTVYAGVRSAKEGEELLRDYQDVNKHVVPVIMDVRDTKQVKDVLTGVANSSHRLVAIVSNANVMSAVGPLEYAEVDVGVHASLDVGVLGTLRLVLASLHLLRTSSSRPRIIIISSGGGSLAVPFYGSYSMNKFALESCGDTLRRELRDVQVALIQPSMISTDTATNWPKLIAEKWPKQPSKWYERLRIGAEKQHVELVESGLTADEAARAICHAVSVASLPCRYRVGMPAKLTAIIGSLVPARLADWILALALGVHPFISDS